MKPLIPALGTALILTGLVYYLLPPMFLQAGGPAWFLLLAVNPLTCLFCGIVFGLLCGIKKSAILLPIFAGAGFIPAMYLFYNDSALVYLAFYVITSVMGIGIGWILYLKK